jgi:predicted nucleic acid-binding protein
MSGIDLFLDSSALIAGIFSQTGASRDLLLLGEDGKVQLTASKQVIIETERNLAKKVPKVLPFAREIILTAKIRIHPDPTHEEVQEHMDWISHPSDVPILVAAVKAEVDFLVTLNRRHFIDDPKVAIRSELRIGTPGDALAWVREWLIK